MITISTEDFPSSYNGNSTAFSYLSTVRSLASLLNDHPEIIKFINEIIKMAEKDNIFIRHGWKNHENEYFLATQNDVYEEIAYQMFDCEV